MLTKIGSGAVTRGGHGALSTVYERLRKRSYRQRILPHIGYEDQRAWSARADHKAYLRGVRDALNDVAHYK